MPLKILPFRVSVIADASGVAPGVDQATRFVRVTLTPVPVAKDSDADLPGTGASGSIEVYFTPAAVAKFRLSHDEPIEIVLRRPGQA